MEVGQGPNWGCSAKEEKNGAMKENGGVEELNHDF
jgi:hypothetical protein